MRRDGHTATGRDRDGALHLGHRPRRDVRIGTLDVELHQVGAIVDLVLDHRLDVVAVLDRDAELEARAPLDPGAGGADVRPIAASCPAIANGKRQRLPVPGRCADVAEPTHPGPKPELAVVLGDGEQLGCRVIDALDPVRASGERGVAVGVDQPRHQRRATGIDHPIGGVARIEVVVVSDPGDRTVGDEHAPIDHEIGAGGIGDRR